MLEQISRKSVENQLRKSKSVEVRVDNTSEDDIRNRSMMLKQNHSIILFSASYH